MNKTRVEVKYNSEHSKLKKFDKGYIDGYVGDPYDEVFAIVVREDGYIGTISIYKLKKES